MRELAKLLRTAPQSDDIVRLFAMPLPWVAARRLEDFGWVDSTQHRRYSGDPIVAAAASEAFHVKAGTLTPAVNDRLAQVRAGARCVRVSHQPNFAAYLKEVSLFVVAEAVAERQDLAPIYVINDCDIVANDRFARCVLPDLTRGDGIDYLRLPRRRNPHDAISATAQLPSRAWLDESIARIRANEERETQATGISPPSGAVSVSTIADDLTYAYEFASTLSEFTAILLSRIVNLRLGRGVPFVSGLALWRSHGGQVLDDVVECWSRITDAQVAVARALEDVPQIAFNRGWLTDRRLAPVWYLCDCGRRVRLEFEATRLSGACEHCQRVVRLSRPEHSVAVAEGRLVPRVGMLDLTESAVGGAACGVSYMSSSAHSLIYGLVGHLFGVALLPQVFLDARGGFGTPVEKLAASSWRPKRAVGLDSALSIVEDGRASALYYLTRVDIEDLVAGIRDWGLKQDFDDAISVPSSDGRPRRPGRDEDPGRL
jgi:hypothetical protein